MRKLLKFLLLFSVMLLILGVTLPWLWFFGVADYFFDIFGRSSPFLISYTWVVGLYLGGLTSILLLFDNENDKSKKYILMLLLVVSLVFLTIYY